MTLRLVMLTPYRMPTHHALMLGENDTLAWQNAWRLLWHPALIRQADCIPAIADAADHAVPCVDTLYVMPESPPPYVPENWNELAKQNGATAIRTGRDWHESLTRLQAVRPECNSETSLETMAYCFGLGFGYSVIDALFAAMDHQKTLDVEAFFAEVKAAADHDVLKAKAAAERLLVARETLYPAPIHLLDVAILGQGELPLSWSDATPLNLVATAECLANLPGDHLGAISRRVDAGSIEVCGGIDHERPDAYLPIESQLWNLRRGQTQLRELISRPASVYARSGTAFHPYLPNWLAQAEISKLFYVSLDGGTLPHHAAATIRWPAPDGRQVDAITRAPFPASDPQTGFHLAMHLHQTIMHDSSAVIILRHGAPIAAQWYVDWLTLSKMAPALGAWTVSSRFLEDSTVGEYSSASTMDDYAPDVPTNISDPISRCARHARNRRRIDVAETYQALLQTLGTPVDAEFMQQIEKCENNVEQNLGLVSADLVKVETEAACKLAKRLVARSAGSERGRLLLNPCPFTRRIGLELPAAFGLPNTGGAIKAAQRDGEAVRLVVDVPGLGYTWIPDGEAEPTPARMSLATGTTVRNELFEAEIDPETGGLRTFRDQHGRANVLGQQLVWQPGSKMRANDVQITACGPALGEVRATGVLVDDHDQQLARFIQRFRAWIGRPMLELDITIEPIKPPPGYAWHDYYAARFAGRDENTTFVRGVFGHRSATSHNRPGSPDYLELHSGKNSALVVTGGLPFAQLHAQRMIDVMLITAGETCTQFQLQIGLNRPQPAQSAQGAISPIAVVPLENGPPPGGPTGWIAHLDSSQVLLTSLRPAKESNVILARFMEVAGIGGNVNLRFARDPRSAAMVDSGGLLVMDCIVDGDAVNCDIMAHDLVNVRVEWP